jgi:hypothetical protein
MPRRLRVTTTTSFLPLIENNNIIKVDNELYTKLDVIGKGGSCKVYRLI